MCAACGTAHDGTYHRLWTCPAVADLRSNLDQTVLEAVPQLPLVSSIHGWNLLSSFHDDWLRYLDGIPRAFPDSLVSLSSPCVDIFTDGSCQWNRTTFAFAGWSVVLASPPEVDPHPLNFRVIAAGGSSLESSNQPIVQNSMPCWLLPLMPKSLVLLPGFGLIVVAWLPILGFMLGDVSDLNQIILMLICGLH